MLLYLVRHGIAVDRTDPSCPPDPERLLTRKGIEKTREVARGLRELGVKPDVFLTSAYLRAAQTAEIVAEALGFAREKTRTTESLAPAANPSDLWKELSRLRAREVICCGHAPNLDHVVAYALGARADVTALKKAGVVCLQVESFTPPKAQLVWLLPPKVLRSLA